MPTPKRRNRPRDPGPTPEHGVQGYRRGCRCDKCREGVRCHTDMSKTMKEAGFPSDSDPSDVIDAIAEIIHGT